MNPQSKKVFITYQSASEFQPITNLCFSLMLKYLSWYYSLLLLLLSRFSRVRLWATLWTAAHQVPLSTGFSKQEYWSGLPFPSPVKA